MRLPAVLDDKTGNTGTSTLTAGKNWLKTEIVGARSRVEARGEHAIYGDALPGVDMASSISVREIELLLREHGASDSCYVLSEDPEIDGAFVGLPHALDSSVTADHPAIISCVPSRLALFVDEAPDGQWLLHRGAGQ